jgi:hypothetical protein
MKTVSITIGPYTVATSPRAAEKIVRDPALLLKTYEFAKEAAQTMRKYGYGEEKGPEA